MKHVSQLGEAGERNGVGEAIEATAESEEKKKNFWETK